MFDNHQGLRNLEVVICKSLNFQFKIHNSISMINHIKFMLIDYLKNNKIENFDCDYIR
jgi:hypothetical protein